MFGDSNSRVTWAQSDTHSVGPAASGCRAPETQVEVWLFGLGRVEGIQKPRRFFRPKSQKTTRDWIEIPEIPTIIFGSTFRNEHVQDRSGPLYWKNCFLQVDWTRLFVAWNYVLSK